MAAEPVSIAPRLLSAAPADHHERRKWRDRQAWRTGKIGIISKLASVGTRFITIPLSLRLLGTERYGLWLTVGSILTWLAVYDLGLSSGLMNTVSTAYGRGDSSGIRRLLSTALFSMAAMSAVMAAVVVGASHWSGLPRLLGVGTGSPLAGDARILLLICGGCFATSFTLNCAYCFASALQEGYFGAYAQISASVLSCALLALVSLHRTSLAEFALVMGSTPLLGTGLLASYLVLFRHPDLRPSISQYSLASLREITACGTPILLSQLADVAIIYTANVLIAHRLGPGAVPNYAVPFSAFAIASSICYGLAAPYQAPYAEAFARGDYEWIRKTAFRVAGRNMAIIVASGLGLVVLGPTAIRLWTHSRVTATASFLGAMAVYCLVNAWTTANGILLIGIGRVKTKAALHSTVAAGFVLGTWFLLPKFGIMAVPVAGTAAFLIDVAISLPLALGYLRAQHHLGVLQSRES